MGFFSDYVTKIVREQTAKLAQQFNSASKSKSPNFTIGKLNSTGDSATLTDGTSLSIINKGKPGQYTQIYNLGGGLGLADTEEAVYYSADSAASTGYVLSFNQSTKTLYIRKPGKDAFLYTFDMSPYNLDYAADSSNYYSQLVSFSPDGNHICFATAMNTNLVNGKRINVQVANYIFDFNAPFYGIGFISLVGNGSSFDTKPGFMDQTISGINFNLNTPILRYVILKNFKLIKDSNGNRVIQPESVLTTGSNPLDILTPYKSSLAIPPTPANTSLEVKSTITLNSSDTISILKGWAPLFCNGWFNRVDRGSQSLFFTNDNIISSEINPVANQGFWRIRGSWSFTSDSNGDPLLEYYAFAESVKYTYTTLINTSRSWSRHIDGSMKIYPQISLDGCGNFFGDFTRDMGWSSNTTNIAKLPQPTTIGTVNSANNTQYYMALDYAFQFAGFTGYSINWTFNNQFSHWDGTLNRPGTDFCAPTFSVNDCFAYHHSNEEVLIPGPGNIRIIDEFTKGILDPVFGVMEACGTDAWPLGSTFPIPYQKYIDFHPVIFEAYTSLPAPGAAATPFPLIGNDISESGWGYERFPLGNNTGSVSSNLFNLPTNCFGANQDSCLGNDCYRLDPGSISYPKSYSGQQQIFPLYAKNSIRDSSMVKINHNGIYTLLNNNVISENQEVVQETLQGSFGPDILLGTSAADSTAGDHYYYEQAKTHGVSGSYEFKRSALSKNIGATNPAVLGSGVYYKIFKNAGNTKFAAVLLESNVIETGILASIPTRTANQFGTIPESSVCQSLSRNSDILGGPPSTGGQGRATAVDTIAINNPPQVWYNESETSLTNQVFSNVTYPTYNPVFTDKVYFPTLPSWLVGALKYRSLDSYTFVKLTNDPSTFKRVLTKYTYDPATSTATASTTSLDRNSVSIPGTIQDIWMPPPRDG